LKKFLDLFPELKSSHNHVIYILEEAFNKYYDSLEDKEGFIEEFREIIQSSKINHVNSPAIALPIEKNKYYFIEDLFYDENNLVVEEQIEDIYNSVLPSDTQQEEIFHSEDIPLPDNPIVINDEPISASEEDSGSLFRDNEALEPTKNEEKIDIDQNELYGAIFGEELPTSNDESSEDEESGNFINEGSGVLILDKHNGEEEK